MVFFHIISWKNAVLAFFSNSFMKKSPKWHFFILFHGKIAEIAFFYIISWKNHQNGFFHIISWKNC
jgi:hypothetical protein